MPQILSGDGDVVGPLGRSVPATDSTSSRWDASGLCQPVISPSTTRTGRSGEITRSVQPEVGPTVPSGPAADSSARVAVVPTAITRPRAAPQR